MRIFYLFILIFLLSNCTSTPDSRGPYSDVGVWEGKVLMTSLQSKQKKWAYLTWVSDSRKDRMRVNVSAVMNYPVATFLKNDDGHQLWIFPEKKHFTSDDGGKLFFHLTKLSMDPRIFYSLLGRPKSPGKQWQCIYGEEKMSCQSESLQTRFEVNFEDADERKIKVVRDGKLLQINLSRTKVQVEERFFKALSSSQFKTIEI